MYIYITFHDNSGGNIISWQWDFGDGSTATDENCIHQYGDTGTYTVTLIVTDANGCIDSVSDIIKIRDIFTLYIPNSFTPNNDGFNDFFFPQGINVDPNNFDMYIFDRLGNLMFHTNTWVSTYGEPWNGTKNNSGTFKDVVMDVYVYRILIKEIQGFRHEYIGRVTLIQ
ncbi:MAG: PKD domain-containing protein, partial [Bacteroidales bacterium]